MIESLEIVDSESEKRSLSITTEANAADEIPRSATVSLSFTDGWDETVSVEFNLLQRTAKRPSDVRSHSRSSAKRMP